MSETQVSRPVRHTGFQACVPLAHHPEQSCQSGSDLHVKVRALKPPKLVASVRAALADDGAADPPFSLLEFIGSASRGIPMKLAESFRNEIPRVRAGLAFCSG